jgi:hypothetical protein
VIKREPAYLLKLFQIPFLESEGSSEWVKVTCPFHKDSDDLSNAHGGINKKSGVFNCFSCGAPANILKFLSTKLNQPIDVISAHADNIFGTQKVEVDPALVELCHNELMCNKEFLGKLYHKHGINIESVQKYRLGYYGSSKRITIPVYDRNETLVNIRQYKYDIAGDEAKILGSKGAPATLFLFDNISKGDEVIITEGEFKAILLNQHGFNAVSSTGGAAGFKVSWAGLFKGKDVVIIFDVDAPGRKAAEKIGYVISRFARSVKNIVLTEVSDISNGDITDYFVAKQLNKASLRDKIDSWTPMRAANTIGGFAEEYNEPVKVNLAQSANAKYSGKLVETVAVVSAKDTSPYVVPSKSKVVCNRDKEYCAFCPAYASEKDDYIITIPKESRVLLELINTGEDKQRQKVKDFGGIPSKCKASKLEVQESFNVEEVRLIPQIKIGSSNEEQVTRKAYYVGSNIACNMAYDFQARAVSEPTDSHATLVLYEASPVENDIQNYKHTVDLSIFSPKEWTPASINKKLDELYADLAQNVTRIYRRPDLHLFYDLAWHSALHINFEGREIKGWCDVLAIGDSGQGKSETSTRMSDHYKCGERIDCKRASVAGIVGGLQETSNRWFVTWGAIPLNDSRLVILEEVKGMGELELARMTDMRSSGIAEISKIERSKAKARTRLIWISNPRSDNKIGAYNYGVEAVRELVGALEDIRRFDMVIAVASGDVPIDVINSRRTSEILHVHTSELCSNLVSFAWSRTANDIVIEDDAYGEILEVAKRMGETYSSACPIVEPADQRLKLARLSVSLAIRTFSVLPDGRVCVRKAHVQVIEEFLNRIYKSASLGYYDYSVTQKGEFILKDAAEVELSIKALPHCATFVSMLLEAETLNAGDISNNTELPFERAQEVLGMLARNNCIKRSRKGGYRKTSAFIDLLKAMDRAGNLVDKTARQILQSGEI